jgi:glycerol-3-phosphate acyltransferase PlsY
MCVSVKNANIAIKYIINLWVCLKESPMVTLFIALLVIAYLLGSVSTAVIFSKWMGLPDPRTQGSGNPGATNMLRVGGSRAAAIVLLGDALKGFIPVLLARLLGLEGMSLGLIALAAVLGHIYPIFMGFQGGKGVATAWGGIIALSVWLGLIAIIAWLITAAITRYSSLAAIAAAIVTTVLSLWVLSDVSNFIPLVLITLLIIWRHQDNLTRLRQGREEKIDFSKFF